MLAQREVTKRKAPSVSRPAQSAGFAAGGRGFADSPSMDCGKSGAIPRAAPRWSAGLIRPPFAAAQRVQNTAKANGSRLSPGRRVWGVYLILLPWLLRPGRPRSAPTGFPLGRGEDAQEKARRGARTTRARSLSAQGCAVSEPPERPREVVWADAQTTAAARVPFSLVTFSWANKRK